jgi:hypothetical protein
VWGVGEGVLLSLSSAAHPPPFPPDPVWALLCAPSVFARNMLRGMLGHMASRYGPDSTEVRVIRQVVGQGSLPLCQLVALYAIGEEPQLQDSVIHADADPRHVTKTHAFLQHLHLASMDTLKWSFGTDNVVELVRHHISALVKAWALADAPPQVGRG